MSFFGGGTDLNKYFEEYGGSVLSTTIDKYCYITVRNLPPFFEYRSQLTYSKIERFNNADEVQHPAVRECLKDMGMTDIHIVYDADLPARSGLGSSSSFAVGLYHALHTLRGEYVSKMELARKAIRLEQVLLKETVGVQDQLAAAFGGLNRMSFSADGYDVKPVIMSRERKINFNNHLMLFFTGFVRHASQIEEAKVKGMKSKLNELHEIKGLVEEGEKILTRGRDLNDFGRLLDHTWRLKKSLSSGVSTTDIDILYDKAISAGALGGKLLGAGGGGFIVFFAQPEKHEAIRAALSNLLHVSFRFEDGGSRVLYFDDIRTYEPIMSSMEMIS